MPCSETNSGNMYTVTTDLTGHDRRKHCGENLSDQVTHQATIRGRGGQVTLVFLEENVPVSVYVTGVYVVGTLQASDWLETDAGGFIGHDVDQSVLEFVARQVGCDKPGRVSFGVSQSLDGEGKCA